MLLSNQIICFFFGFLVWSDCVSYIGRGVYSDCRMALVLQSLFSFSCCAVTVICYFKLPHSQTYTHTHYSTKRWMHLLKLHCDPRDFFPFFFRVEAGAPLQWFASFMWVTGIYEVILSLSGLFFPHSFPLPKKCSHSCMYLTCTTHNSLIFL